MEARSLLQELRNDQSVPHRKVEDLAAVGTGRSDRNHEKPGGAYPFYVRSKDVLSTDTFEFDEQAIVIPGEGGVGEIFHFADGKYALHQRAYRIAFHSPDVYPKFAYYFFQAKFKKYIDQKSVSATVTSIRKPMITDFRVPLPALEVQREIVMILDTFRALEAELEAELHARSKQFEYFSGQTLALQGSPRVTLGELVEIRDSERVPISRDQRESGDIPYYGANGIQDYVADYLFEGDFLLVGEDGSVINKNGSPVLNWATGKIWVNNHAHVLSEKSTGPSLRFLYYALARTDVKKLVRGTPPKLNQANLKTISVPLPPIELQNKIVGQLDAFEAHISGIQLELSLRRKQYAYCRDQLLAFTEA